MTEELTPKFKLMPIYRCADCNLALGCQQFYEGQFDYNEMVASDCPLDTYGELPEWLKELIHERIDAIVSVERLCGVTKSRDCVEELKMVLTLRKPENNVSGIASNS